MSYDSLLWKRSGGKFSLCVKSVFSSAGGRQVRKPSVKSLCHCGLMVFCSLFCEGNSSLKLPSVLTILFLKAGYLKLYAEKGSLLE